MAGIEAADWSAFELPQEGLRCEEGHVYSTGVRDDDPLSARVEGRTRFGLTRPGLDVVAEASGRFTCTEAEFVVELDLAVTRDGEPFHRRTWRERHPPRRLLGRRPVSSAADDAVRHARPAACGHARARETRHPCGPGGLRDGCSRTFP